MDHREAVERLKARVQGMVRERDRALPPGHPARPAAIWAEVLGLYRYLFHLDADDLRAIRWHTGLISGEELLAWWHPDPPIDPQGMAEGLHYAWYVEGLPEECRVGEPPVPGVPRPLGVVWEGRTVNTNTARYQGTIANLWGTGILDRLGRSGRRVVVLEIGGGFGGLALHLGRILSGRATVVVVDFPEMLLFSGAYLMANHPPERIHVHDPEEDPAELLAGGLERHDHVLLPNYLLPALVEHLAGADLAINMQSFQEMAPAQLQAYIAFAAEALARRSGWLYSDNMEIHPWNSELAGSTVTRELERRFELWPPPEAYDRPPFPAARWGYRVHLGVPRGQPFGLPAGAWLKAVGGNNKAGPRVRFDWNG